MRDRAAEILAEEADLAARCTWRARRGGPGGRRGQFPRLHLPFDRLLAHTAAPTWTVTAAPEGPDVAAVTATGWDPVVGDGAAWSTSSATCWARATGWWCAPTAPGSAARLADLLGEQGIAPVDGPPASTWPDRGRVVAPPSSGASSTRRSSWRCWPRPT